MVIETSGTSIKYMYKGINLWDYCIKNDLSYYSVILILKERLLKETQKQLMNL